MFRPLPLILITLALGACQSDQIGSDQGTAKATYYSASTSQSDDERSQQTEKRALSAPVGQKLTWNNPETGNSGTVTVVRDNYDSKGSYCRDMHKTSLIDGQSKESSGKVCQQSDGSWKSLP